jgi:hypothetical protein
MAFRFVVAPCEEKIHRFSKRWKAVKESSRRAVSPLAHLIAPFGVKMLDPRSTLAMAATMI